MKLSQLISKYHSVCFCMRERDLENDPLGTEADELFARIERTKPVDADDIIALAHFARHVIESEQDPYGAVRMLRNIADWAGCFSMQDENAMVLQQFGIQPVKH